MCEIFLVILLVAFNWNLVGFDMYQYICKVKRYVEKEKKN